MQNIKLSSKYQIVIPAKLRRALRLGKGSKLVAYLENPKKIALVQPENYAESLRGLGKEVWEALGGSEKYLQNERNSWDK